MHIRLVTGFHLIYQIFESHDDIEEDYLDGFSARELRENYHNYEDESTSELDIGKHKRYSCVL